MKSYVYGIDFITILMLTLFYVFLFQNEIKKKELEIDNYLEIGCGHGLFLLEAINRFEDKINYEIVDISKTSIDITKSIIDFNVKKKLNIQYKLQDVLKYETKKI